MSDRISHTKSLLYASFLAHSLKTGATQTKPAYAGYKKRGFTTRIWYHLQDKIRQDSLTVIDRCETEDELDFLFPELTRIHDRDLAVLESWQNHVDWMRSLPSSELKLL